MINKKLVFVGGGVSGMCAVTKLVDEGYPGNLITVIDKGKDPHNRKPEEVMCGGFGAGLFSDGKLTYHHHIGGQLAKYCGEEKAYDLMDQVIKMVTRFHPKPEVIMKSDPQSEPDFIKPYFGLRLFPVYHIGSDFLHEIGKRWYDYLVSKGVNFLWQAEVIDVQFEHNCIDYYQTNVELEKRVFGSRQGQIEYDILIFGAGKSGIDFSQSLITKYNLPTEAKSVQLGVRFEAPQKYFQRLIDISYDFKLYKKHEDTSLRSFCTNNNAAYVAVEETYGDISYNGHALKDESKINNMTNFGILMEIKGIENPFEWSRNIVKKSNFKYSSTDFLGAPVITQGGIFYSPNKTRIPSITSEGNKVEVLQVTSLNYFKDIFEKYADYIIQFIDDMNKVFEFGNDWGIYIPEVKYVSEEPIVNYNNLSLINFPNVHFVGDALSARGISVAGSQGIYVAESILKKV